MRTSLASELAIDVWLLAQFPSIAVSTSRSVCSCDCRFFFIVASMDRRIVKASIDNRIVAMTGQIQICFLKRGQFE
jgi:hypothetical protein